VNRNSLLNTISIYRHKLQWTNSGAIPGLDCIQN